MDKAQRRRTIYAPHGNYVFSRIASKLKICGAPHYLPLRRLGIPLPTFHNQQRGGRRVGWGVWGIGETN